MGHGARAFKDLTDYHLRAYSTVYALTVQFARMRDCQENPCAITMFPVYISIGKHHAYHSHFAPTFCHSHAEL